MKKYACIFALQAAVCAAVSLCAMLLRPVRWAYIALIWAVVPLVGMVSAFKVARRGVNPYLSWILPPIAETFAGLLASMGYAPSAGGVLLTALTSLIGGAAADVLNRQSRKRGK